MTEMKSVLEAVLAGATGPELAAVGIPEAYRGVVVRAEDQEMFAGMTTRDKDPRQSLHLDEVPTPEVGPGEALIAVMACCPSFASSTW